MDRRLYLAYGSNLSREQLRARCPQAAPLAPVTVHPAWRLAFFGARTTRWGEGGVATLLGPDPAPVGPPVAAALYELTADDEARLDGYEGCPSFYKKRADFAPYISGFELRAGDVVYAYLKNDLALLMPPSRLYLDTIAQGYRDWGFHDCIEALWLAAGRAAPGG